MARDTRGAQKFLSPVFSLDEQRSILGQFKTMTQVPDKLEFVRDDFQSPAYYRYFLAYFVVEAKTEFAAQVIASELTTKCAALFGDFELSVKHSSVSKGGLH